MMFPTAAAANAVGACREETGFQAEETGEVLQRSSEMEQQRQQQWFGRSAQYGHFQLSDSQLEVPRADSSLSSSQAQPHLLTPAQPLIATQQQQYQQQLSRRGAAEGTSHTPTSTHPMHQYQLATHLLQTRVVPGGGGLGAAGATACLLPPAKVRPPATDQACSGLSAGLISHQAAASTISVTPAIPNPQVAHANQQMAHASQQVAHANQPPRPSTSAAATTTAPVAGMHVKFEPNTVQGVLERAAVVPTDVAFRGHVSSKEGSYTECTLQGLILDLQSYEKTMSCLKGMSDTHTSAQWVDQCWRSTQRRDKSAQLNFLLRQEDQQDLWVRHYLFPVELSDESTIRAYSSAHVTKSITNVRRCREANASPSIVNLLVEHMGYRLNHEIYVQAEVFHTKYGNTSHVMTLVQRHFKDKDFTNEAHEGSVLVEAKARCSDDTLVSAVEANLKAFAEPLKLFLQLRKVDL